MSANGKENNNDESNANGIVFIIKDTKLFVPVVNLSPKDNQKLSKSLRKGFERSGYCNGYKTKSENKNMTNEYRYFLESNFAGVIKLFILVYSNQDTNSKRFKTRRYYQNELMIIITHHQWKKLLWPSNWFRSKTIWRKLEN